MRTEPARLSSQRVISSQVTGGTDNYKIADYQWRPGDTPARNFRTGVRHCITRPHDAAITIVERIQDPGCADCINTPVAERGRGARTGTANRLPEPSRVAVSPYRFACTQFIAGYDLVV